MLIYKDATRVEVADTTDETTLFTFDLDRNATLTNTLPLGPNQAVRITCFGEFIQGALTTPSAYFRFKFGNIQTDQIIDTNTNQQWKIQFDCFTAAGNKLAYNATYIVGDNEASSGDDRVGTISRVGDFDPTAPIVASLSVELNQADPTFACFFVGYFIEVL